MSTGMGASSTDVGCACTHSTPPSMGVKTLHGAGRAVSASLRGCARRGQGKVKEGGGDAGGQAGECDLLVHLLGTVGEVEDTREHVHKTDGLGLATPKGVHAQWSGMIHRIVSHRIWCFQYRVVPLKLVHFEGANNLHTRTTAIEKDGDEAAGGAAGAVSNTALPPQQDCM
jgi:hypothetical protein